MPEPRLGRRAEWLLHCCGVKTVAILLGIQSFGCGSLYTGKTLGTLSFIVQPSATAAGEVIAPAIQVAIQDAQGETLTNATDDVTVALANAGGATLAGRTSVKAINGVASFSNLRIRETGTGYKLSATASGYGAATSAAFDVRLAFASVSAGASYTCGVTTTGAAYCWGDNSSGQLGDGTTAARLSPVPVGGGLSLAALSAGYIHACGVTTAGAAYCWGSNNNGQLGDGTTAARLSPVLVEGGLNFAAVSAGGNPNFMSAAHTCGVATAGAAYCWGLNYLGQLGDGTTTTRLSPALVAGGLNLAAVSAGGAHTCGVTTAGAGYCWGNNGSGELGGGTASRELSPVLVGGGLSFAAVSAGSGIHTCGVTTAGAGYCWGYNFDGQLGDGTSEGRPSPVLVRGGLSFAAVSAGNNHTCGVTTAGVGYCWGLNYFGQLGDGTTSGRLSPVPVRGGLSLAAVSTGDAHTCGVTTAGAAYCWGLNSSGQLGNGSTTNSSTPVPVSSP